MRSVMIFSALKEKSVGQMQLPDITPNHPVKASPTNPEEPWINSYNACHHLGISIATLHRRVKNGKLKPKQTPGVYRFRRSDLNSLLR